MRGAVVVFLAVFGAITWMLIVAAGLRVIGLEIRAAVNCDRNPVALISTIHPKGPSQ